MLTETAALRILSTRESMIDAEGRRALCVDELAGANATLKDRRETEDQALDELQAARAAPDHRGMDEAVDRLGKAAEDRKRAEDARELADRKAKQAKRLLAELETRMLNTIDAAFGLGDGGQQTIPERGQEGPDAWKRVELADLMGPTFAQPFIGGGLTTVGEARKSLERVGEKMILDADNQPITPTLVAFLRRTVAEFLARRGIEHSIACEPADDLPEAPEAVQEPEHDAELAAAQAEVAERVSRHGDAAAKTKRRPRGTLSPEVAAMVPNPLADAAAADKARGKR